MKQSFLPYGVKGREQFNDLFRSRCLFKHHHQYRRHALYTPPVKLIEPYGSFL